MKQRIRKLGRAIRIGGEFRPYLQPHRARLLGAILLSVVYAGLRLLEPWPLQIAFDHAILGQPTQFLGVDVGTLFGGDREMVLLASAGALLAIALLSGWVYYVQNVMLASIGQDVVRDLRTDLFHQMQRLSLPFHRRAGSADLLVRLTGDMVLLRDMILASLVTLTTQTLVLISVIVLMLAVSWKLTLVAVVLAPLLYALFAWFRGRMVDASRQQRRREGRLAASIEEVLLAIPMIQAYTAEEREDERFRQICKKSARAGFRAARLEAAMQRMVELFVAVGTCLVLWYGTREVMKGALTPGIYLVFLAYLRSVYKPIRGLSKVTERSARAAAAMERVLEVLRAPREIKDSKRAQDAPPLQGAIRFEAVRFAYEDGTPALDGVSFDIPAGQRVALVGPSGAGKSTLVSLILRFHRPTEGKVRIDGHSVKDWTLASLRTQIAYLPQEPFLLGVSVRENLLYGKPEATDEELWAALRAAELEDLVRAMPEGLDTELAQRGQSLSGGERQRLAIARAMLKDAPIVLLDEPATALDARTEVAVLGALERLCRGRTTLIIAHKLSTIRTVDRVLVLEKGRLIEDGPPAELLTHASLFRAMADLQAQPAFAPSTERGPASGAAVVPAGTIWVGQLQPDEGVKGVPKLLAPGGPEKLARELGLDSLERVVVIKQRLGQRAIVRLEAERNLYAKLIRSSEGARRLAEQQRIAEEAASCAVIVPRPTAWVDRFRVLAFEEVAGAPLLEGNNASPANLRAVGAALARLHQGLSIPERVSRREAEMIRLDRARDTLETLRPELTSAFDRTRPNGAMPEAPLVTIHGDFYPAQVLVCLDGAIAVLDWDECARGEAERDLANFTAHLELEVAGRRAEDPVAEEGIAAFLDGYRSVRAFEEKSFAWYRRATLLRLTALYSDPAFGPFPPNPRDLAERLLARVRP
ncbi:MAG: ATP-binding cassette domain-containing protein [Candidatus Eisenbacteria bacterium]|nr:ATP-binding cassette domain-containing protein [Candidatus Eisenbacteria bacterium]